MSEADRSAQQTNAGEATVASSSQRASESRDGAAFGRTLLYCGIVAFSAGLAFALIRSTLVRPPADPTTERIQQLIDEANRLLAQLDDKKSDS